MTPEIMAAFSDEVMKIASSALRSKVVIKKIPGKFKDVYEMWLAGGKRPIGEVEIAAASIAGGPMQRIIRSSRIDPQYQGMGLGRKFYGEVMRREPETILRSDTNLSGKAIATWEKLRGNPGYKIERAVEPTSMVRKGRLKYYQTTSAFDPMYVGQLPEAAALS